MELHDRMIGSLLGTAVGDALGLCCEGLSRQRAARLYPHTEGYQLFGGRGMGSDDTDHAAITAWALLSSQDVPVFRSLLRRGLRRWFWSLPAGIGWATLRSSLKMSLGMQASGVFSAGNGPVMRAPILGAWSAADAAPRVRASTELTHTDPKAYHGALLVAQLTQRLCSSEPFQPPQVEDAYLQEALHDILTHPEEETLDYCQRKGWSQGVSGYVYHTVPVVVQACLRYRDDFAGGVQSAIRCGGDSDTTAAIVGGVLGARLGKRAIPEKWLREHKDWPVSLEFLESLVSQPRLPPYPAALGRNLLFGGAILGYGLRRLLPPY